METLIVAGVVSILAIIVIVKTAVVVPQQSAYVIETLGRYSRTLAAGFHLLIPFMDRVAYKHTLKEQAIDVPEQLCITSMIGAATRVLQATRPVDGGAQPK